jgi:Flp pilus assembly pilin Flp
VSLRGRLSLLHTLAAQQEGQAMAEYAFILGLVFLVSIAAFTSFGQAVLTLFGPVVSAI